MANKRSALKDVINKARATSKPANKKPGKKVEEPALEEMANLSVKVPLAWRKHWLIECKKADTSLTDAIVEALTERFGKPRGG